MADNRGSVLSYHKLHYSVEVGDPNKKCGTVRKDILNDINGVFQPGMNAILGPTGSGKTSLLDLLAGRKDDKDVKGHVLVDSRTQPENFRLMAGYVVQDDVVMGTLTARENFMFSANLRLPKTVSKKEKEAKVDETIKELGLVHCADTKLGTEFIRGVSGGERKRTNIGMELIISPSMLFLDEPTTGLDASTANAVMLLLHRLSRKGRTMIFSVHQPRFSIFRQFDRMTLLSLGHTVYHGPADSALDYFRSIGYVCEEHNNPPDFFLDVINGDSSAVQALKTSTPTKAPVDGTENSANAAVDTNDVRGHVTSITPVEDTEKQDSIREESPGYTNTGYKQDDDDIELGKVNDQPNEPTATDSVEQELAAQLAEKYQLSGHNASLMEDMNVIFDHYIKFEASDHTEKPSKIKYQTSFFTQLYHVAKRTVLNIIRNPMTSILQVAVMIIFAVITGTIYFQLEPSLSTGIQNRVGAFFFIVMNQIFGNLSSVELFIKERAIFMHENAGGFYRVSSYFVAKLFCDVIPMRAIPVLIFSSITYFMIGFQVDAGKFFFYTLVLFLTGLSASSIGFFISSCVGVFAIANLLMALSFVFMMLFGGLLVNIDDIVEWLRWLQYLSIFRYSLNGLTINEFKDMCFYDYENTTGMPEGYCFTAGHDYMDTQGISYDTDWDLWQNVMALGIITTAFLIFTFIRLWQVKKIK